MVKTIIGNKGSGKTKKLVDLVIEAVNEANGDVVVIEKDRKLTFDIPYQARLIDAGVYDIGSYEFLKGAICGIHSGNYDITHIFIDNFFKLVKDKSDEAVTTFFTWLCGFAEREHIDFVVSVTCDKETAPAILKELSV
ncbi:MAG: hypothetical protein J6M64_00250 [Oscillospiraceae bacterium]|jgi:hypothetical protein|nr:hypothetical protein [Oscillospiraceae bacterium]